MKEKGKIELVNTALLVGGILSVFFAGFVLEDLFYLSLFLFIAGVIILSVKAVPNEKEKEGVEVDSSKTFEQAHAEAVDKVTE